MSSHLEPTIVSRISPEDVEALGFDVSELTQKQLDVIGEYAHASFMASGLYWEAIEQAGLQMSIPKREDT